MKKKILLILGLCISSQLCAFTEEYFGPVLLEGIGLKLKDIGAGIKIKGHKKYGDFIITIRKKFHDAAAEKREEEGVKFPFFDYALLSIDGPAFKSSGDPITVSAIGLPDKFFHLSEYPKNCKKYEKSEFWPYVAKLIDKLLAYEKKMGGLGDLYENIKNSLASKAKSNVNNSN